MTMTVHNSPPPFSTVPSCAAHLGRDGLRSPTMPRATPTICMIAISTAKPMAVISGMSAAAKSMWLMGRVGFKDSTINYPANASPNAPPNTKHEPIPNPESRMSNITFGRTLTVTGLCRTAYICKFGVMHNSGAPFCWPDEPKLEMSMTGSSSGSGSTRSRMKVLGRPSPL